MPSDDQRFQALRDLMDERDKRYGERFEAQEQALKVALEAKNLLVATRTAILGAAAAFVIAVIAVIAALRHP